MLHTTKRWALSGLLATALIGATSAVSLAQANPDPPAVPSTASCIAWNFVGYSHSDNFNGASGAVKNINQFAKDSGVTPGSLYSGEAHASGPLCGGG